jgi:DNA-binding transcriptional ArsR family regulator
MSHAWHGVVRGHAGEDLAQLREACARQSWATGVIEATALRALVAEGSDHRSQALELARRASLMARTEGLPQSEYLAHLVLARVRRSVGRPHLATRILTALRSIASPHWWPWLDWELGVAGGAGDGPLARLLSASDAQSFLAARAELTAATSTFAPARRDFEALVSLIDPDCTPGDPEIIEFRSGRATEVPRGLHGACLESGEDDMLAYVSCAPGRSACRLLRPGPGRHFAQPRRRQGRLDTALSVLLLAGPGGVETPAFFQGVYGFPFVEELHVGALDVLLHRLRERLGSSAVIQGRTERLAIEVREPIVVCDPRCGHALADLVLKWLAQSRGASAKELSERLEIPLRTIQETLQELVEDGACASHKAGRSVEYRVEDTVFSEPTRPG